ncbi:hypothetical protein FBUS_03998 [Fasciolopsis buskii]|uniref:TTI1 C-terminal TPR domain-containing protein n=1 Tax=Fasciolopsis buskii TaxID=27845 RepID=A0A8E0S221_9TREM|nr:hypothetical protein FBUS_03998 [Fasciolopsis buski]
MLSEQTPNSINEDHIQNRLRSMHGYLSLMDPKSPSVLASSRKILRRLCSGLGEFLAFNKGSSELDLNSASSANPFPASSVYGSGKLGFPNEFLKPFNRFRSSKTLFMTRSVVAVIASQEGAFRCVAALETTPVPKIDDPFLPVAPCTLENINQLVLDTRRIHGIIGVKEPNSLGVTDTSAADCTSPANDRANKEPNPHVYPDELHTAEQVMLRCIHLMATDDPKFRLLSMAVLEEGCLTLRDAQDLLLPLVHKIWSSLLARFRDWSAVFDVKAFQILLVLSNVVGDLLRSRATSDLMSSLLTFMGRDSAVSANASKSYRHLTSYRVQRKRLARLGSLSAYLNLGSEAL